MTAFGGDVAGQQLTRAHQHLDAYLGSVQSLLDDIAARGRGFATHLRLVGGNGVGPGEREVVVRSEELNADARLPVRRLEYALAVVIRAETTDVVGSARLGPSGLWQPGERSGLAQPDLVPEDSCGAYAGAGQRSRFGDGRSRDHAVLDRGQHRPDASGWQHREGSDEVVEPLLLLRRRLDELGDASERC